MYIVSIYQYKNNILEQLLEIPKSFSYVNLLFNNVINKHKTMTITSNCRTN